jgi:hypothetical protein
MQAHEDSGQARSTDQGPDASAANGHAEPLALPELVQSLKDVLGSGLVAVIADDGDADDVESWARGESRPRPIAEQRVRCAFDIVQLMLKYEAPRVIQAWFLGMNPELDDRAAALVIRDDPTSVLDAARYFLAHG